MPLPLGRLRFVAIRGTCVGLFTLAWLCPVGGSFAQEADPDPAGEPTPESAPSEPPAEQPDEPPAAAGEAAGEPAVPAGPSPTALFTDFMHYARLGKFQQARAFATSLLAHPDLDPVLLLEAADKDRKSFETLVIIINNSSIGEEAKRVLEVLRQGEARKAQDPERINQNIEGLGGPPQAEHNAIERLITSGEDAVPWMVQALTDPARERLRPRVVRALPKIGRPAVTPLAVALAITDRGAQQQIIRALGELGYPHAVPYLKKVVADSETAEENRQAAAEAIGEIARRVGRSFPSGPAEEFARLGELYYREEGALRADPRDESANVWYWRDNFLTPTSVPTAIFGAVMAMRSAEEALKLEPANEGAISLWLSANIRREARLGLDVESGEAITELLDRTRPEDFPRALFFTRAAGARYAQSVLERAVADKDPKVALGAIAALRAIAGEAGLVGAAETQQPLVKALGFPDSLVRARAALALAEAHPRTPFVGHDRVVPVLGEALLMTGRPGYVVVEPDASNLNRIMDILRAGGAQVVGDTDFHRALDRARQELKSVSGMYLSTALSAPGAGRAIEEMRREALFGMTPVILLEAEGGHDAAVKLESRDARAAHVPAQAGDQELADAMNSLMTRSGQSALTPDRSLELALESAEALLGLARDGRTSLSAAAAEPAMIGVLQQGADEGLRTRVGAVLGFVRSEAAQRAVAGVALDSEQAESLRIALLASLSESAKLYGNLLAETQVAQLVSLAAEGPSLALRTAASQALGALNIKDNKASDLIRKYHRG